MPALDIKPACLCEELKKLDETVLLEAPADILASGLFGEEWVIVSDQHLRTYTVADGTAVERIKLTLSAIKIPLCDQLVGGGALVVTVNGKTLEVARFTNACQRDFHQIAKYLGDTARYAEDLAAGKADITKPVPAPDTSERRRCPTCQLLLQEGTKVCPACLDKGKVLARLVSYLRPYWRQIALIWFFMIIGILLSLIPPYLTRPLMDKVLAPTGNDVAPVADRVALLGWLVLGLLITQIASLAAGIIRSRLLVDVGTKLCHDLRLQLYSHLQYLSLGFYQKHPVGSMIARVTQDTQSLEAVLVDGVQHFVVNILLLVGIGAVLFVMNWKLALLVLIPVPTVVWLSHTFWLKVKGLWHRYWHARNRVWALTSDALSGTRVVRAFAKEKDEIAKFRQYSLNQQLMDTQAEKTWATFFPILWFIASIGSLLVWYFGGRDVIGETMTLGTMMTFLAYLGMFYGPLQFLSRIADYLARSLTSAERVFEILDTEPEIKDAGDAVTLPKISGHIEFRNVTFSYEPHKPVIKRMNLDVKPGEMIGLVGRSGAGKSTTVNLICRFFDVSEGEILIDGVNIKKIRQEDLRSQIGIVLQDTFLFNGTIAENISYARPDASREEIMAAAKAANAHDFIVQKPEGYDTRVGERGQSLSGGERQRVAIARAVLHNPRILVLDEATAAVDTETEKQIQEAIARMVKGRTTFAIAHRLSTLRNANRIVFLKDGEVIEVGTHKELMDMKGEFHRLVTMQQEISSVMEVAV